MIHLPAQLLGFGAVGLLQHLANFVVSQPRVGVNHRFIEGVTGELAGGRDGHLRDHSQTIHQRVQRAQTVGQHLRQHGDHPLGEIHRVAAILCLAV